MYPTLVPESSIIIRQIEPQNWGHIKDNKIYVISDNEGTTVVKRVFNALYDSGLLKLVSDNRDKSLYYDYSIHEADINNIFEVELYFTNDLNAFVQVYNEQLSEMQCDIKELKHAIIDINRKL